jgi:hypothetical protein
METYSMDDRPLLDRLNLSSHRALMIWTITYAINHREEISPEAVARMRQGTQGQKKAAEILSRFGLDLPRS